LAPRLAPGIRYATLRFECSGSADRRMGRTPGRHATRDGWIDRPPVIGADLPDAGRGLAQTSPEAVRPGVGRFDAPESVRHRQSRRPDEPLTALIETGLVNTTASQNGAGSGSTSRINGTVMTAGCARSVFHQRAPRAGHRGGAGSNSGHQVQANSLLRHDRVHDASPRHPNARGHSPGGRTRTWRALRQGRAFRGGVHPERQAVPPAAGAACPLTQRWRGCHRHLRHAPRGNTRHRLGRLLVDDEYLGVPDSADWRANRRSQYGLLPRPALERDTSCWLASSSGAVAVLIRRRRPGAPSRRRRARQIAGRDGR